MLDIGDEVEKSGESSEGAGSAKDKAIHLLDQAKSVLESAGIDADDFIREHIGSDEASEERKEDPKEEQGESAQVEKDEEAAEPEAMSAPIGDAGKASRMALIIASMKAKKGKM